ncbi:hypothetical protein WMY93_020058 [Mugilogobius chulae]|uniref:Uncharacterized protein n=1 Tax=Mugilogobius chulae TaxID=88201 RepID=A0AAW0NG14_9GOBI
MARGRVHLQPDEVCWMLLGPRRSEVIFTISARKRREQTQKDKQIQNLNKMSKDWAEYTLEDDKLLYTEEFNLTEVLGDTSTPFHLQQTPEAPKPEEAQSREELLSKQLEELRLLRERERLEYNIQLQASADKNARLKEENQELTNKNNEIQSANHQLEKAQLENHLLAKQVYIYKKSSDSNDKLLDELKLVAQTQLKEKSLQTTTQETSELEGVNEAMRKECEVLKEQLKTSREENIRLEGQAFAYEVQYLDSKLKCCHLETRCSDLQQELKRSDQQRLLLEIICTTLQQSLQISEGELIQQVQQNIAAEEAQKRSEEQAQTTSEHQRPLLEERGDDLHWAGSPSST